MQFQDKPTKGASLEHKTRFTRGGGGRGSPPQPEKAPELSALTTASLPTPMKREVASSELILHCLGRTESP